MARYIVECRELKSERFAKCVFDGESPSYLESWTIEENSVGIHEEWSTHSQEFDTLKKAKECAVSVAHFEVRDADEDYYEISACFAEIFSDDDADFDLRVRIDNKGSKNI